MAVTSEDLIYPRGRIHRDLFPGVEMIQIADDVGVWIAEAAAMPRVVAISDDRQRDRAVSAWAYYRAFDAATVALAANPAASAQTDAGSATYARDQRDRIATLAAEARGEFEVLAPEPAGVTPVITGSRTTVNRYAW